MTLILPICGDPTDRLIYRALIAAGREYDAYLYATLPDAWIRDTNEAVQALLRICNDITIVWQEAA